MEKKFETQDEAMLYYHDQGQGKPLVLVHGWRCTSAFFKKNATELAKEFRVISVDLRGHGNSAKTLHGHTIPRYARDLRELIMHLNLDNVTLLGWSMGGSVVLHYWKQFSQDSRLSKIILYDNSLAPFSPQDWNAHRLKNFNFGQLAEEVSAGVNDVQDQAAFLQRQYVRSWFQNSEVCQEELDFFTKEVMKTPPWIAYAILTDFTFRDASDVLPTVNVPTLVLAPGDSQARKKACEYYLSQLPHGKIAYFEAGHTFAYTQSEKFNKVVADFVREG